MVKLKKKIRLKKPKKMNKVNSIQLDKPRDSGHEIEITP
jgi:hypothetical protein